MARGVDEEGCWSSITGARVGESDHWVGDPANRDRVRFEPKDVFCREGLVCDGPVLPRARIKVVPVGIVRLCVV